jgi:putative transposase
MFIRNNLSWININIACKSLKLKRSSYYDWLKNEPKRLERLKLKRGLLELVKSEHVKSKQRYGSPKITKKLKKNGVKCGHNKIAKLMRENNIRSIVNKKYKATTNSKHNLAVFDNILERKFTVPIANSAWVGDITYVPTGEGWLYLATVLDLFSNKIIGYAMSDRINKQLVIKSLNHALKNRGYPTGVIVHTDRGSQYASNAYKDVLKMHQLIGSMSRKANCWDNAVAENFFGIIKKEFISLTNFATRAQARLGIFDYIEAWYNTQRIHSKLDYLTPVEFEQLNINLPTTEIKNVKMEGELTQL